MNTHLSNYEVRAYKNGNGKLAFHCKTVMMIDCGWNFSTSCITRINAFFVLNDDTRIDFDISLYCDSEFKCDGRFNTITLDLSSISTLDRVCEQTILIAIEVEIEFPHGNEQIGHKQYGVIQKRYVGL